MHSPSRPTPPARRYQQQCIDAWIDQQMQARACRNAWVNAQILATAIPGADCASRGPANYQTCINDWVKSQQARSNLGSGSTCASLGPE
jgi:hypothetical protein